MRRLLLLVAVLCCPALTAQSQSLSSGEQQLPLLQTDSQPRPVTRLGTDAGLSQGNVYKVLQDKEGFLWIATQAGLNKYDGYSFTVFEEDLDDPLSLSGKNVNVLEEDSTGNLWLSTVEGGLQRYDKSTNSFTRYSHSDQDSTSLIGERINFVHVSADGTVWVGTDEGLNRYNSEKDNFARVSAGTTGPDSLALPTIESLHEDKSGYLWLKVSGRRGDAYLTTYDRLDPETNSVTAFLEIPADSVSPARNVFSYGWGGPKQSMFEDSHGNLWFGVTEAEDLGASSPADRTYIKRYDASSQRIKSYFIPAAPTAGDVNWTMDFIEDYRGRIWTSNDAGMMRFDEQADRFVTYPRSDLGDGMIHVVVDIVADPTGILWMVVVFEDPGGAKQDETVFETFDVNTFEYSTPAVDPGNPTNPNVHIIDITRSDNNGIWFDSPDGVDYFDNATRRFTKYAYDPRDNETLAGNSVRDIFKDRTGVLWMAHNGAGVSRLDPRPAKFRHVPYDPNDPHGLPSPNVWSFFSDSRGDVWVGTNMGLSRHDPETGGFNNHLYIPVIEGNTSGSNSVSSILEDSNGRFWVGASMGLTRFDRSSGKFTEVALASGDRFRPVFKILEDSHGTIWVGSSVGLQYLDPDSTHFSSYTHDPADSTSISSNSAYLPFEDSSGNLWVATIRGGLNRFDPTTKSFTIFKHDPDDRSTISSDYVSQIAEIPGESDILWLATYQGLNRFDTKTGKAIRITKANSDLPDNVVYSVVPDDRGFLWLSTNRGLSRYDPRTQTFTNYDTNDGLQSMEFNGAAGYKAPNGALFFGGVNGFNVFFPDQVKEDLTLPAVALTSLTVYNPKTDESRPYYRTLQEDNAVLTLSHNENDLTFEFAALHFANPKKNLYKYRLEPYEASWSEPSHERLARYSNLPAGSYSFRIQASNPDGTWNEEGATFRLVVKPPWWKTIWAYIVYGLLLAGGVFVVDRVQRRRLLHKQEERARLERAELEAVAAAAQARALQAENAQKEVELTKARELEFAFSALQDAHDNLKTTQDQLVQQEKLASLGQLTAGIAHEIKNPLNFVNNFAEVSEELAQELREAYAANPNVPLSEVMELVKDLEQNASLISQHGKRADSIVRSMMQHASGGAGHREPTDINELVSEHVDLAYHGKRSHNSDLSVEILRDLSPEAGAVEMIPQDVGRVILNLVGNALDAVHEHRVAHPDYRPEITVSTRRADGNVEIRIADNGPGIPVEIREKIFEPFFTTKPTGSGTGLGLSMSYDIVTKGHGGTLRVESVDGKGATFILALPAN